MFTVHVRRCKQCDNLKGFQAFDKGKHICKKCIIEEASYQWEHHGVEHKIKCKGCGVKYNLFTGYHKSGPKAYRATCKQCISDYYKMRNPRKFICMGTFVFDGKRFCKECEEIKEIKYFSNDRTTCRECLGLTPVKKRAYNRDHSQYIPPSESDIKRSKAKIKLKEKRRNAFIEKFNNTQKRLYGKDMQALQRRV